MQDIFDDERRGSGPMAPDPGGTGRFFAGPASRAAHGDPTPPRRPLLTLAKNHSRQTHHLIPQQPLIGGRACRPHSLTGIPSMPK